MNTIVAPASKKTTWPFWVVGILLVLGAVGTFGKTWYENKLAQDLRDAMAGLQGNMALKAETVSVSLFDRTARLGTVTATQMLGEKQIQYTIEKAEAKGLNLIALSGAKGVLTLADSLVMHNISGKGEGLDFHVARYALEGIKGDFGLMAEELNKLSPEALERGKAILAQKELSEADLRLLFADLPALLRAAETIEVAKCQVEDYNVTMAVAGHDPVVLTMASMEAAPYSMRHIGGLQMRDIRAVQGKDTLFSMAEVRLEQMKLPSYAPFIAALAKDKRPKPGLLLQEGALELKNLEVSTLHTTLYNESGKGTPISGPMDLESLKINLYLPRTDSQEATTIQYTLGEMVLSRAFVLADNPELVGSEDLLPETFKIRSSIDLSLMPKDKDVSDITLKNFNFSFAGLGAITCAAEFLDINLARRASPLMALRKADIALTNTGFLKYGFSMQAAERGMTPELLLMQTIAGLEQQRDALPREDLQALNASVVEFLRKPEATLNIEIAPEKPITMTDAMKIIGMGAEGDLGLSSSVSVPGAQAAPAAK